MTENKDFSEFYTFVSPKEETDEYYIVSTLNSFVFDNIDTQEDWVKFAKEFRDNLSKKIGKPVFMTKRQDIESCVYLDENDLEEQLVN